MVDEAVDEGGGAGCVGEDGGPLAEGQVGGDDDAPALVAAGDHLEEQVGVAVVIGEVADLVDDEQAGAVAVVAQPLVEGAGRLLGAEVEQELGSSRGGSPLSWSRSDAAPIQPLSPTLKAAFDAQEAADGKKVRDDAVQAERQEAEKL